MIVRDFELSDINKGLIETLNEVWSISEISEKTISDFLSSHNHMMVIEYENQIIGCATLHLQHKLIRNGCIAGFIEEVVIREKYRNNNLGSKLIEELLKKSKKYGCYKVVLNCFPERVAFYERNGFHNESICMRYDF